jgi:hypothetical protein
MVTRFLVLIIFGFLNCAIFASDDIGDVGSTIDNYDLLVVDNRRKDRRDDRKDNRDGKQDCRQEEGRVGNDKRECKQENRGDGDEGDKEDKGDDTDA